MSRQARYSMFTVFCLDLQGLSLGLSLGLEAHCFGLGLGLITALV